MEPLTLDAYIEQLVKLREQHGNLPVEKWMPAKGRHAAPTPVLAFRRRYNKSGAGGEGIPQFYNAEHDNVVQRGDPVVRV